MNETVFIGEVPAPEITKEVLDKGIITVYVRVNQGSAGFYELNQDLVYTMGSYEVKLNGFKEGKIQFIHVDDPTTANSSVLAGLTALSFEARASIILSN